MNKTNIYNEYLFNLRSCSLREPCLIIKHDIVPMLLHYIKLVDNVEFKDGSYHTYYGEIKKIVNSFTIHWTDVMDEAIKEADVYIYFITKEDLVAMVFKTIELQKQKQAAFIKEFIDTDNPIENAKYTEIQELYVQSIKKLDLIREEINRLDKRTKIEEFARDHFPKSLERKNLIFSLTYDFISVKLSLSMDKIRISLEEILNRLRNNVKMIQDKLEDSVSDLLMQLYEKNKENLILSRQDCRSSVEAAEVQRGMDIIIDKIDYSKNVPVHRLEEECNHWEKLFAEFSQIEKTLKKIQEQESYLEKQEKMSSDNQESSDKTCLTVTEELEHVRELKLKAAKALFTFFSVRGDNYIYYKDKIGTYLVDEYGHQVYVSDYGLNVYHVDCEGNFIKDSEKDKYYYDDNGRYIIKDDQKLYQIAPCSSKYRMENEMFIKHTKDCGHSERANEKCRAQIMNTPRVVLLPEATPVDIKGSLSSDVVKYLWDSFGHILPDVLEEVALLRPKNPIHCLAHKLLHHKYKRSRSENEKKKEEAALYRHKIHQDKVDKVNSAYEAWRAKQAHAEPEWEDEHALREHRRARDLVRGLDYYN